MDETKTNGPSWTWIVAALMTLLMFFGAYGWNSIDSRITKAEGRTSELAIQAAEKDVEYREIIRRLDRIERAVENIPTPTVRAGLPKSQGFNGN